MKDSRSLTSAVVFRPDLSRMGQKYVTGGLLLQKTSSSDRKATATNRMHSNDLEICGKKCCYLWCHSEVKFWRVFDVFLDLVCSKLLFLHLFCVISMFRIGRRLLEKIKCFKIFNDFFMYLFKWRKRGGGGCTNACICIGTHSRFLLQNRLTDVNETW